MYYILDGHKVVATEDFLEWGNWFRKADRHVGDETRDGVRVSTVFLSLNHSSGEGPPLLFETMVFGGEHDGDMDRYSTWEEAEQGHKRMCEIVFAKESQRNDSENRR